MNKFKIQKKSKLSKSSVSTLALLSAKITLKFGFLWREFIQYYKQHLVKEAKRQNPNYSIVELASRTGIDRRDITNYLQVNGLNIRPSKIKLTLQYIKSVCEREKNHLILKKGPFQTFESICNITASGTLTPQSIAKELIRQGNIKDKGQYYELLDWKFKTDSNANSFVILSTELNRLTDTTIEILDNFKNENSKVQRNIYSTQINPDKFNDAHKELKEVLYETIEKLDTIILSYEEDVPLKTYPAFGASMFTFGPDHNKNNEESNNSGSPS